jgi:hypothetical protein
MSNSKFCDIGLLLFAKLIWENDVLIGKLKSDVAALALYDHLKPIMLQRVKAAGIKLHGALSSVAQRPGELIFYLSGQPLFWVTLAAGVVVLGQLGLEYKGIFC